MVHTYTVYPYAVRLMFKVYQQMFLF